jgi:hypothetical protein
VATAAAVAKQLANLGPNLNKAAVQQQCEQFMQCIKVGHAGA